MQWDMASSATNTVLLTLGRLPKALEIARCLHRAGCRVIVAEPLGWHLCKGSRAVSKCYRVTSPNDDRDRYRQDLIRIIEEERVGLVIPVSEEIIHVAEALADGATTAHGVGASFPEILRYHDKAQFIALAKELGLRVPETAKAKSPEAAEIIQTDDFVIKPALGCAGSNLRFGVRGQEPAMTADEEGLILQRRVRGQEISTLSLCHSGSVLGTSVYKGLVLCGTVAVSFERQDDLTSVEEWVRLFVERTRYSGFIAFDFILDDKGDAWPIECNPRVTSGVHFFDHDSLAKGLTEPSRDVHVRKNKKRRLQDGHTTLALAYANIARPRAFFRRVRLTLSIADVKWSWQDPIPFLFMTTLSLPILWRMVSKRLRLAEATTIDIEWRPR
ncbi:MAG: ATP-grasp domain-containing protein [Pseudomonadota bacterium]